jgi:hypothetical protein
MADLLGEGEIESRLVGLPWEREGTGRAHGELPHSKSPAGRRGDI